MRKQTVCVERDRGSHAGGSSLVTSRTGSETESVPGIDRRTRRRLLGLESEHSRPGPSAERGGCTRQSRPEIISCAKSDANGASRRAQARGASRTWTTPTVHSKRLGSDGHCQFAGGVPLQGAMCARCSQFPARPVQVSCGYRTWKVFRLTSRMILWREQQRGPTKAELERRMDLFQKQEWVRSKPNPLTPEEELVRRGRQAEKSVHQGQMSRARQALCSQARAPGTVAT